MTDLECTNFQVTCKAITELAEIWKLMDPSCYCVVPRTQQLRQQPSQPLELACGTLPVQLRNLDITHGLFRRQLKRHLFREAWTSICSALEKHLLTYWYKLLTATAPTGVQKAVYLWRLGCCMSSSTATGTGRWWRIITTADTWLRVPAFQLVAYQTFHVLSFWFVRHSLRLQHITTPLQYTKQISQDPSSEPNTLYSFFRGIIKSLINMYAQ